MSAARKRVIDYDVDGTAVWCNAPGCTNRDQCEACELTSRADWLDHRNRSDPMVNRTQGIALEKRRKELLAEAAQLDELALSPAPCKACGFESEVTREQADFGETPLCVECGKWDARMMRGEA